METFLEVARSGGIALVGIALTLVGLALRTLGPQLVELASRWLERKGAELSARTDAIEDERTRGMVNAAKEAVFDAVRSVSQDMVPKIRAAAQSGGGIDAKEREGLRQEALARTKKAFGPPFWKDLGERMGVDELDEWLLDQVETHVFKMKAARVVDVDTAYGGGA